MTKKSLCLLSATIVLGLSGLAAGEKLNKAEKTHTSKVDVSGVTQPAEGLPKLSAEEVVKLREFIGLHPSKLGRAGNNGKLGELKQRLGKKTDVKQAARSAKQVALGLPRKTKPVGAPSVLDPQGRWLGEVSDVAPLRDGKTIRAGAVWSAWVTRKYDVTTIRKRPRGWQGPRVPKNYKLRKLPLDWRGLFAESSTGGLENGMSRGHIMPNASATFTLEDQRKTFRLYSNAFPQSRDSNAGAWRNLEKTIQNIARGGEHVVYNYSGVLWNPVEYKRLDGSTARVEPEMLKFSGGIVPKPSAYWRVAVVIPLRSVDGRPIDLAEGIMRARPISVIVPNAQDADLFVSDWARFSTTVSEVEKQVGVKLFTHLEGAPRGRELLRALRSHKDSGVGLPRETGMPKWKIGQIRELLEKPHTVSREALSAAKRMLIRNRIPFRRGARPMSRSSVGGKRRFSFSKLQSRNRRGGPVVPGQNLRSAVTARNLRSKSRQSPRIRSASPRFRVRAR